jgi:hypothetical protein
MRTVHSLGNSGQQQEHPVSQPAAFYIESWKKGKRQVEEKKINIKLDTKNSIYETAVRDISGQEFYRLSARPNIKDSDFDFSSWGIFLVDIDDNEDVLAESHGPRGDTFDREEFIDILFPEENPDIRNGFWGLPLSAKRVIKVEGFYCIIQVKSYEMQPNKYRVLQEIEVEVEFTNDAVYFFESWKKGTRQVEEKKINIRLDTKNPIYERAVRDASGREWYRLRVEPRPGELGDIDSWKIILLDKEEKESVLEAKRGFSGEGITREKFVSLLASENRRDLYIGGFFGVGVPLSAKRVIKVESFYCVIQARNYKFHRKKGEGRFESIEIEIEFTNEYKAGWKRL